MPEFASFTILDETTVAQQVASGLISPFDSEPLKVIDCGDSGQLTLESAAIRQQQFGEEQVIPGRFFGTELGFAATAIAALCARGPRGEQAASRLINRFNGQGLIDLSTTIKDSLHERGTATDIHSANTNEGHESMLTDPAHNTEPLGCAFAANFSTIFRLGAVPNTYNTASRIAEAAELPLPLDRAYKGIKAVSNLFPDGAAVNRDHLWQRASAGNLTVPILDRQASSATDPRLVYDLAGFASDPAAHRAVGIPRHHTTPLLAKDVLPDALPTFDFDPDELTAGALLLAVGTGAALEQLSRRKLAVEIIPASLHPAA